MLKHIIKSYSNEGGTTMEKTYIFLADGFEEIEGLMVVDLLRRASIDITTVSISDSLEVMGGHGILVKADKIYANVNFDDADMLILPGGAPGTKHLSEHKELIELLVDFNKENKRISAICAAPSILGMNGILQGKKAVCYPGFEDKLLGAIFTNDRVVSHQNIITSKGLGTALEFAVTIIEHFKGAKAAKQIKDSVQY